MGQSILPASEESLNAEIRNSHTHPPKRFNNKELASLKEKHHLGQCFKVEGSVYQKAIKLVQVAQKVLVRISSKFTFSCLLGHSPLGRTMLGFPQVPQMKKLNLFGVQIEDVCSPNHSSTITFPVNEVLELATA